MLQRCCQDAAACDAKNNNNENSIKLYYFGSKWVSEWVSERGLHATFCLANIEDGTDYKQNRKKRFVLYGNEINCINFKSGSFENKFLLAAMIFFYYFSWMLSVTKGLH